MTKKELEQASRPELIAYLESWGFACYDNEPTEKLREAALQNHNTESENNNAAWLHEAIERRKEVTEREITRPGEKRDFFDIETAPIPLPFGQKKEKILKNFTVKWMAPAEGDPKNCDHLECIPKPDSPVARKYEKLDFFVDREVHLPRRIVITSSEGLEIKTADFPDLALGSINVGLTDKDFARPAAWKGYEVFVEPLPRENKADGK